MAQMVHGRGGPRWGPPSTWPRALAALALLLVVTVATGLSLHAMVDASHPAVSSVRTLEPETGATPEDDLGGEPTATARDELAAHTAQAAPTPLGPHVVIPVLLYHYVRVNPVATDEVGFNLSVTPSHFAQQMAFLHATGAHVLTLADVMQHIRTSTPLPPRSLVLTFDDGYKDFATVAAPTLVKYGFKGVTYVVSGFVGRSGYMNADQVRQVDAMGMVVGCHTVHHVDLASEPAPMAAAEIQVSHRALQELVGHPVLDFAYPYGGFNGDDEKLVAADGFRDAVTTVPGDVLTQAQPMAWPRLRVGGTDTLESFARKAYATLPAAQVDQLVRQFQSSPALAAATPSYAKPIAGIDTGNGVDSRRYA